MSKIHKRFAKFKKLRVKQIQSLSGVLSEQFVMILDNEITRVKEEISEQITEIAEDINDNQSMTVPELKRLKQKLLLLAVDIVYEPEEDQSIRGTTYNINAPLGQLNTGKVDIQGDSIGRKE